MPIRPRLPHISEAEALKTLRVRSDAGGLEWIDAEGGGPHTHDIADVTGLQTALDGKQDIGGGATNIKQTEVDFGATPLAEQIFTITDGDVSGTSQIIGYVAYEAPTDKDLDELTMDSLVIQCGNGTGSFDMHIRAADGSYLADKFKINYLIG